MILQPLVKAYIWNHRSHIFFKNSTEKKFYYDKQLVAKYTPKYQRDSMQGTNGMAKSLYIVIFTHPSLTNKGLS